MSNRNKWTTYPIRVRYQETDQMGVVYHTNYINWFEWGRTEWIREHGMEYRQIEEKGLLLPVVELQTKFIMPAKYDDLVVIKTKMDRYSDLRIQFSYEISRKDEEEILVSGLTEHVWVNANFRPTRLSHAFPEMYEILQKYEC